MEKHMILATIRMTVSPKKRDEALKIFKLATEYCKVKPGCLSSHVYLDAQEQNTILYKETWRSQEEMDHNLRSDEYYKILLTMEMAVMEPDVRFNVISETTGIETIEKARKSLK